LYTLALLLAFCGPTDGELLDGESSASLVCVVLFTAAGETTEMAGVAVVAVEPPVEVWVVVEPEEVFESVPVVRSVSSRTAVLLC
jgi:hypothetical protein